MPTALAYDVEANGRREVFIEKKNKQQVVEDEVSEVHCIVIRCLDTDRVWRYVSNASLVDDECDGTLLDGWHHLMSADLLVAHNGLDYDMPVLRRLVAPADHDKDSEPPQVDTLVWSRYLYPDAQPKNHPNRKWVYGGSNPNSLETWGRRFKCFKGEYTGGWERLTTAMLRYCVQDTVVLKRIYEFLLPLMEKWPVHSKMEHAIARIISEQTENGVTFNTEAGEEFWQHLISERARLNDEMHALIPPKIETLKTPQYWEVEGLRADTKGELRDKVREAGIKPLGKTMDRAVAGPPIQREIPFNCDSDKQVYTFLMEHHDWDPIEFTDPSDSYPDGQPKVSEDILAALDWPEAAFINECRMVNKRIGMLRDWITRTERSRDGRIHGSVNTNGTPTTRMTHRQPNITQVTKVIFVDDEPLLMYPGRYGWESRRLFGPRPGWLQVGADASGLELRMLANRTWPFDDGAYAEILLQGDVHSHNMENIPLLVTRPQAKEAFYAGNYGAGDKKQGKTIATHKSLSPEQRAWYRKKYGDRKGVLNDDAYMRIGREFKAQLAEGCPALGQAIARCQQAARTKGCLILLDGRRAPCRSEHSALNTQLQGDGSTICKLALVLAYNKLTRKLGPCGGDWALMITAHDEQQYECRPDIAESVGKVQAWAYAEAGRRFGCHLETPGEYKIGKNWAECH